MDDGGSHYRRRLSAADANPYGQPGLFPSYLCGNVVRDQVLEEHPERAVLTTLNGTITDGDRRR